MSTSCHETNAAISSCVSRPDVRQPLFSESEITNSLKPSQPPPTSPVERADIQLCGNIRGYHSISSESLWLQARPPDLLPRGSDLQALTASPLLSGAGLSHRSSSTETERALALACPLPALPALLPSIPESQRQTTPSSSSAEAYFRDTVGSESTNRVQNLLRATDGLIRSQELDLVTFAYVLDIWARVCDGCGGSIPRLKRLSQGLAKFKHHFTDLLGEIYFAHEVEHLALSNDLNLMAGQKRQNAAFTNIAKVIGIPLIEVKARYKKSKNILLLLKEKRPGTLQDGPGTLLQIGPGVASIWETKLSKSDVEILLQYRAKNLHHIEDQARANDTYASQILLNGMISYGWTYSELVMSHSSLAACLRRFINLNQLADKIEGRITEALGCPRTGEDSGSSKEKIPNKRRYDDPGPAVYPVKRIQRAGDFEELDISRMMQCANVASGLDITTMMQYANDARSLDITTMMQPASVFGQLDISMEMQPVQNSGRNISDMMEVAQNFGDDFSYLKVWETAADGTVAPRLECCNDTATGTASPWPEYTL